MKRPVLAAVKQLLLEGWQLLNYVGDKLREIKQDLESENHHTIKIHELKLIIHRSGLGI